MKYEDIEVSFTIPTQKVIDVMLGAVDVIYWLVIAYGAVWVFGWCINESIKYYNKRVNRKIATSDFGRSIRSGLRLGGWHCQGGGCRDEHDTRKWRYTNGEGRHQRILIVKIYANGHKDMDYFNGEWQRWDVRTRHGRHMINWVFDNLSIDI
ncbi:hypothetical protein VPHK469_0188 [Vibrio phage K469]